MSFLEIFQYLLVLLLLAFVLAKLEINIEGKHGWAKNLPTWRTKNALTKLLYGDQILTGYHFWLLIFMLVILHYPFLLYNNWSIGNEFKALSLFYFVFVVEDFLWFVLNPHYGIKKFNPKDIAWHTGWFWKFPTFYFTCTGIGILFLTLSFWL